MLIRSRWAYLVLVILLGGMAVSRVRDLWSAGWACFEFCLVVTGLLDRRAYPTRRAAGRLSFAQSRFALVHLGHGLYWAAAGLVLILSHNPLLQFWIINAETAVLSLTVARLKPMGEAIEREIVIAISSVIICGMLSGNVYFQRYGVLATLHMVSILSVTKKLNNQTVRLLVTEERNAGMLRD
jgi:hypothetical protein